MTFGLTEVSVLSRRRDFAELQSAKFGIASCNRYFNFKRCACSSAVVRTVSGLILVRDNNPIVSRDTALAARDFAGSACGVGGRGSAGARSGLMNERGPTTRAGWVGHSRALPVFLERCN